jgi:nitric oxide synthase oxygenase domain/subunit
MNFFNSFEQFLRQYSEMQRGIFNSWSSMIPNMQSFTTPNFRETFEKTLSFQETMVASSLEFQALLARLSIDTQKHFWENYFNLFRK